MNRIIPSCRRRWSVARADYLDLPRAEAFCRAVQECEWDIREIPCVSPFAFHIFASNIREGMQLEDEAATLERICHELYLQTSSHSRQTPT